MVGLAANEMRKRKAKVKVSDSALGSAIKSGSTPFGGSMAKKAGDLGIAQAAKPTKKKINTGLNIASKY